MSDSGDDRAAEEELRLAFGRAIGFTLAALLLLLGVDHLLPIDCMRRLARHTKPLVAAGQADELRSPVTAVEGRVDPFQAHHSSPRPAGDLLLDRGDAPSKRIADALRSLGSAD